MDSWDRLDDVQQAAGTASFIVVDRRPLSYKQVILFSVCIQVQATKRRAAPWRIALRFVCYEPIGE